MICIEESAFMIGKNLHELTLAAWRDRLFSDETRRERHETGKIRRWRLEEVNKSLFLMERARQRRLGGAELTTYTILVPPLISHLTAPCHSSRLLLGLFLSHSLSSLFQVEHQ